MPPEPPGPSVAPPPLRVEADGEAWTFDRPFTVGREACDVTLDEARVSRRHLEVTPGEGGWWVTDLGSANGTLVDGARVERVWVDGPLTVQVGEGGPVLRFVLAADGATAHPGSAPPEVEEAATEGGELDPFRPAEADYGDTARELPPRPDIAEDASGPAPEPDVPRLDAEAGEATEPAGAPAGGDGELSYDAVVDRYFRGDEDDETVGERTRFIRQAYEDLKQAQEEVHHKERSTYKTLILAALAVSVAALGYAGYLQYRTMQYRAEAEQLFYELKTYEIDIAEQVTSLERQIEENPAAADSLSVDLERARAARQRTADRYDRFVRALGVYDGLSSEEEAIYRVARNFGESEITIPDAFVDEIKVYVAKWRRSGRFQQAVRHAQVNGFDVQAVNALRRNGMPTEFFYLALQESNFDTRAVGPPTRYGHAKGAWQFIPETGRRYGLEPGPLVNTNQYDPLDERHDFGLAADAAGRYLHDIYTHLAQASGLLVCASYNWGEGRVRRNMDGIARELSGAGIRNNPESRTYWKFLTTYRGVMPHETKDYVMNIFAAAVIGQNPRMFGIDMDPPVQVALRGGTGGIRTEAEPASGRAARLGTRAVDRERAQSEPAPE